MIMDAKIKKAIPMGGDFMRNKAELNIKTRRKIGRGQANDG